MIKVPSKYVDHTVCVVLDTAISTVRGIIGDIPASSYLTTLVTRAVLPFGFFVVSLEKVGVHQVDVKLRNIGENRNIAVTFAY